MNLIRKTLDFLLPPQCAQCGVHIDRTPGLCVSCWEKIHFIADAHCRCCGYPFEIETLEKTETLCLSCHRSPRPYTQLKSSCVYDEASKPLLLRFKHGDGTHLAPLFVQWLAQVGKESIQNSDLLIPVPLHWRRLVKRGYNQAALLAQGLGAHFRKPVALHLLRRSRHTPSQGIKSLAQRHQNVSGAFSIKPAPRHPLIGQKVVLVDDVYASGATLEECARVLNKHGVQCITILTIARVLRPNCAEMI